MNAALPKTKLIATIGPASAGRGIIRRLLTSGVAAFRLNLSHGDLVQAAATIAAIRELSSQTGRQAAVLLDLPGPKMRLGVLAEPVAVSRHQEVIFCADDDQPAGAVCLPHDIEGLAKKVRPGDLIYIGDGMLQFRVKARHRGRIHAEALLAGVVRSHKGINIPTSDVKESSLTDYDRRCLAFAVEQRVDAVCISFVGRARDITAARELLPAGGTWHPCLVAKIERRQAVEAIDAILAEADAVMVARGDLGIELPLEEIPVLQKEIIAKANMLAKPVIVATQMLLSMVENTRPTRAEVTDVANAILDGADAVMFSEETAVGVAPVEVVRTARRIARRTERELLRPGCRAEQIRTNVRVSDQIEDMISSATHDVLANRSVALAVTPTSTGTTARRISRLRPRQWVVAITDNPTVRNILALSFGVLPLLAERIPPDRRAIAAFLRERGLAGRGDRLVVTNGEPGIPGSTNSLHVIDLS